MEWLPIETAPRDGSEVLLLTRLGVVSGWYAPGEWIDTQDGREYEGPSWVCYDDLFEIPVELEGPLGEIRCDASHWMQMPELPEAVKESEG